MTDLDRYYSGITGTFSTGPAAETVFTRMCDNQKALVQVTRDQASRQEVIARDLSQTNSMIAKEVRQNTEALMACHEEITRSGERVSSAVQEVGDTICAHLGELHWLLQQQQDTLDGILYVLRNRRKVEAQELVRQGWRHHNIGDYAEAEERFRKALEFDSTDYQVLLSMGFIETHNVNLDSALNFFTKALLLPDDLDSEASAQALWQIARLHYVRRDFAKAHEHAEKALAKSRERARRILDCGIYAALAGREAVALERIQTAVELKPGLMTLALVAPDLDCIRPKVGAVLDEMANRSHSEMVERWDAILRRVEMGRERQPQEAYRFIWDGVEEVLQAVPESVREDASYSECREKVIPVIAEIEGFFVKHSKPRK